MDDTDQETMQAERKAMLNSKNRDLTPEKNLELFEAMLKGEDVSYSLLVIILAACVI